MNRKASIVGSGLIGRSWAIAFARAGWSVAMWDQAEGAAEASRNILVGLLEDLGREELLDGQPPADVAARVSVAATLPEALDGTAWVQENTPEIVEIKREVWSGLDPLVPPDAVCASSTSGIVPSAFTEHLGGRGRCLVAHPINPPYLIPAVELVPAPWTTPETMKRAEEIMRAIGQSPIVMSRELDGFVMNRLQGALLEEAFRLVADGYCTVEDVDVGLREGLALRWSFIGPFETIDLNAPGGVRDYVSRYGGLYEQLYKSMQRRADWTGEVLDKVERQRRERTPADKLADRQRWRDRRLMALSRHKRNAATDIGN
ncbi:3-hydroxyacyl-CoA dehydrogenase [Skermanella mucosa]|uniref:3-hydroxyacyl-CoA dehydrogenase n=1 Tax=Skermanella mucosa TaxID=1789672 RepID=UPI00192AC4AB|nr:3-hydroxyacyl-CoA dehydrogenase [Skermanella mucosa]UEM19190.1 3-hydroxyacyl-CoA dehydrogenase [Skermanella mucosa]